jgi:hypothetical protein
MRNNEAERRHGGAQPENLRAPARKIQLLDQTGSAAFGASLTNSNSTIPAM